MKDDHLKYKEAVHITENIVIIEGAFYHKGSQELKIIGELVHIVDKLITPSHSRPVLALITNINNQNFILMDIVLNLSGPPKNGIFALLDNKTLQPISGVIFSNQTVGANTNPDVAKFSIDPADSNKVLSEALALGSGSVIFSADASYTDPGDNSAQSGVFTVTKNYSVVPSPDGASLDVIFS